jgi:hypothetical protein
MRRRIVGHVGRGGELVLATSDGNLIDDVALDKRGRFVRVEPLARELERLAARARGTAPPPDDEPDRARRAAEALIGADRARARRKRALTAAASPAKPRRRPIATVDVAESGAVRTASGALIPGVRFDFAAGRPVRVATPAEAEAEETRGVLARLTAAVERLVGREAQPPPVTVEVHPEITVQPSPPPDVHVNVEVPRPRPIRVEELDDGTRRYVPEEEAS